MFERAFHAAGASIGDGRTPTHPEAVLARCHRSAPPDCRQRPTATPWRIAGGWRLRIPPPAYPEGTAEFTKRLSQPVHLLLYALMVALPVVGIVAFVWHARVFDIGLFKLDFHIASNKPVYEAAEEIHEMLAYSLFGLAGLHGLAALWHHFVQKDGILVRMWPPGKA